MKPIAGLAIAATILGLHAGCTTDGVAERPANTRTAWMPPSMPDQPPPLPKVTGRPNLAPPRYPDAEQRAGIPGEVLVDIEVGAQGRVSGWKIVRATTPGYANSVIKTLGGRVTLPGISPGRYSWSFVFYGSDDRVMTTSSRPGTFWVGSDSFGD